MTTFKVGMDEVGHHGFFAETGEDFLWPRATEWLRREIPLVMEQREAAENAKRAAKGLPPKPTKQELARVTRLRATISAQAEKKAAEAAAEAERLAAEAAKKAEEASRKTSRRRGRRRRDDAGGGLSTLEERRAQRASRRRAGTRDTDDAAITATPAAPALEAPKEEANALQKLTAKFTGAGRGAAKEPVPTKAEPEAKTATGLPAVPTNAEEARRQAAAIAKLAKAGERYADEREAQNPSGSKASGGTSADRFRRVPSRRDVRGVKDTDVD